MVTLKILFYVCLVVVVYTYVGYGLILWILVKLKSKKTVEKTDGDSTSLPEVTLCIAAYNEEAIIEEKMRNVHALDYPKDKLRVVWITDGSTDKTNEKLKEYDDVIVLFSPERRGKTAAINRGMKYINTPIVVFTDANTMLNNEAISKIVKCFADPHVGCVAGEKRIEVRSEDGAAAGGEGMYWKYESTLKRLDSELCTAVGAAGELYGIRRELFEPIEEDTLLDDFILSMRIAKRGYKIEYCAEAYAIESGSADMNEERKRKVRISAGGLQSIWRLRPLLNHFKYGMMSFQYVSHRVLRWSITPLMLFLLLPLNIAFVAVNHASAFYWIFLVLQVLFYLLGAWGYYLSTKQIKNKILYIPYYFLFMNVNVIKGFFYLRRKKGSGVWEKAKRSNA
jgi:cellulose synthase/poly-beta-1,6-N-acetylglucosamine synthase-like glycosyltransferase